MAEIKVCIEVDEAGTILVGAEPPEGGEPMGAELGPDGTTNMADMAGTDEMAPGEEETEQSYMQEVGSIEEALSVARDLLKNAGQVGPALEQQAADSAFKASGRGRP